MMKGSREEREKENMNMKKLLFTDTASTDQEHTTFTWSTAPAERRTGAMGALDWLLVGH